MHPLGMVGVGDRNATREAPTERLDLLDGRLRIRDLPTDLKAGSLTKVLVVEIFPQVVEQRNCKLHSTI